MSGSTERSLDPSTLRGRALAVALLSATALFMENLDATILTTGLPAMARDFHVTPVALNVGITAYLLTLAVLIPASGWVADRFGERKTFATAVLVFTVASACCAASRTLPWFLASRVLQGAGGAMMVPVGRLMVVRSATKPQLMKAIAYTIWPALTAPILGPVVGGWIIHVASWPWMFLLNLPIGFLLFGISLAVVRDSERQAAPPSLDGTGVVLTGLSCLLWVVGLELFENGAGVVSSGALLALGLVCTMLTVSHMRRSPRALFAPALFRIATFRTVMVAGSLFRMAVFSVPFLLPLLFQTAFGLDALRSGSLTMAVFAGNLAMKPLTTPLLRRYGFRGVLLGNGIATVLLLAACGWLRAATPVTLVLLILFLGGAGRSMELTALTTLGFADLSPELTASGTTFATMVQQMTVSLGVSVAALVLHLTQGTAADGGAGHGSFRAAFCAMSALALCSLISFARLPVEAGSAVSGHRVRTQALGDAPAQG
ncbi:MFS transporter [Terriglobus aquaticus]|uniref:MFS transporter n=1 Tax=Terriglobus aquaticus TaxID=940139 RepID=A0ABW9KK48_9BACT|nr:MFS transporter [Terriglobus aquaticus]